jgi:hypothetical protein
MSICGRCGRPFSPGDQVDVSGAKLPGFVLPLIRPHISRLIVNRCPGNECGGLITALYLPRTPAQPKNYTAPAAGDAVSP